MTFASPTILPPTGDPLTQSAITILSDALSEAGLAELAQTLWSWWKEGRSLQQINLDIRSTPEFRTRFAGLEALAAKGRSISPGEYISIEKAYSAVMRAAGLPESFYDGPEDFANMIGNEISPAEFQDRITGYTTLSSQMPSEVLDAFAQQSGFATWASTGWSNGDLAAFFIDPNTALPAITKRLQKAQISGASTLADYGELNDFQVERLASLGVDYQTAQKGFATLARLKPLFEQRLGSTVPGLDTGTQLEAVFGSSAESQRLIEQRQQEAMSPFAAGGSLAGSARGQSGAGSSR